MTAYPPAWLDTAADAAHKALHEVEGGWHYNCGDKTCGEGADARFMLTEDVIPAVLDALARAGALKEV